MTKFKAKTNERIVAAHQLISELDQRVGDIEDGISAFVTEVGTDVGTLYRGLSAVAERLEELERRLPTEPSGEGEQPEPEFVDDLLSGLDDVEIARAIFAGAVELELPVSFIYTNGDNETLCRTVSPYELKTTLDGRRFVLGWDHTREGIRQFEIGKLESPVVPVEVAYRQPEA